MAIAISSRLGDLPRPAMATKHLLYIGVFLLLTACGDTVEQRAATGALGGAAVGTVLGGPIVGTAAGATVGAASGR
jgi:osmotically inducible lipoprotein OsmB